LVLPARHGIQPAVDDEAVALAAAVVARALHRGLGPAGGVPFRPAAFGCLDPHVASGDALGGHLQQHGIAPDALLVDTPERAQGLERAVTLFRDSLGGPVGSDFDFSPGRHCVGLTRHTHACAIVARDGAERVLDEHAHDFGARALGGEDIVRRGIEARRTLGDKLVRLGRRIHV
jgi:hypothetical protein